MTLPVPTGRDCRLNGSEGDTEIGNRKSEIDNVHRGIVSTASTSVSKTESPGSNPGTPATSRS